MIAEAVHAHINTFFICRLLSINKNLTQKIDSYFHVKGFKKQKPAPGERVSIVGVL